MGRKKPYTTPAHSKVTMLWPEGLLIDFQRLRFLTSTVYIPGT